MRTRLLGLAVLVFAAGRLSAATYTVTNTSDSGAGSLRQAITDANSEPRSRYDRLQHSRQRRPHDRAHHLASECDRRAHGRRLHAARLVAEHAAALAGNQRRPERGDQRSGRHAGALLVVSSRRRAHPGCGDQPLCAGRDLHDRVSDAHRQLPRHVAGGNSDQRRAAAGIWSHRSRNARLAAADHGDRRRPRSLGPQPHLRKWGRRLPRVQRGWEGPGQSHRHRRDRFVRDHELATASSALRR